jgi:hypothetical protein
MNTERLIVALLLIAIIFSVITLAITLSADVKVNVAEVPSETSNTASVILDIVRNPAKEGGA